MEQVEQTSGDETKVSEETLKKVYVLFYCDLHGDLRVAKTNEERIAKDYAPDSEFIVVEMVDGIPTRLTPDGYEDIEEAEEPPLEVDDEDENDAD